MEIVFICIKVEIGSKRIVLEKLKQIEGVKEAYQTYGEYDIIAKIQADSIENIKKIIQDNIRKIEKIKSSLTMIVIP